MRSWRRWSLLLIGLALGACGTRNELVDAAASSFAITIQGFAFSPPNLDVPPGATVVVHNLDSVPHSVTSESVAGSYTPGGVNGVSFDTGAFGQGDKSFSIPSAAPIGTVVPYYCTVHKAGMANSGQITIRGAPGGG